MAGKLYLVGTPIGNLKDITLRALETLKAVDIIACEDTRHSLTLLGAYDIKKPLVSYYKHKEREGSAALIAELSAGKDVALITDAGMPSVSDPGAILVEEARAAGFEVTVIPGASAVVTAVALSGIRADGFTFLGFLPEKTKDKKQFIAPHAASPLPLVFYCSPHNVVADAAFLYGELGDRKAYVVKELTKLFESVIVTSLAAFEIPEPRGEYVLIVEGATGDSPLMELSVEEHIKHYMQSGLPKKEAVKRVAAERGLNKNDVYQIAIKL